MKTVENTSQPFFSVIIPVYNVERYLARCVDSVLEQDCQCIIEVILINDGSTDTSGRICDDYAAKYEQVRVVHKENGGQSSARNIGLEMARGEYIVFLDSDDWLDTDAIRTFESVRREGLDFIAYGFRRITEKGVILEENKWKCPTNRVLSVEDVFASHDMFPNVCAYVYRREFLQKNNLRFAEGMLMEDAEISMRVACCASQGIFLEYAGYNYLQREGSTMFNKNIVYRKKYFEDYYVLLGRIEKLVRELPVRKALQNGLLKRHVFYSFSMFWNLLIYDFPNAYVREHMRNMRVKRYLPLRPWTGNRVYQPFRWMTFLPCPIFLFRAVQKVILRYTEYRTACGRKKGK